MKLRIDPSDIAVLAGLLITTAALWSLSPAVAVAFLGLAITITGVAMTYVRR